MPIYALDDYQPEFEDHNTNWIAPDATLIGQIFVGRKVGIWFGTVIRGDNEPIIIGHGTNVQEHTIMHTDIGCPLTIGAGCTIGHRALLHGCTIGENSLIGMGAIVLNTARIGCNCLVGAGALITEGKDFPDNSLIIGSPARVARVLNEQEIETLKASADHYVTNGCRFMRGLKLISLMS